MIKPFKINNGIYLVVDPSMEKTSLIEKLTRALEVDNSISAVQIWDHFPDKEDPENIIDPIKSLCIGKQIPVIINNQWELTIKHNLDGVHFDTTEVNIAKIRKQLGKEKILGVTVNNDLDTVKWADKNQLNYISFCSIFPSKTSNSCDLVEFETIKNAREITAMPIFLAGGIVPENLDQLKELDFQGVAVISGIMSSQNPAQTVNQYIEKLKTKI